MRKTIVITFSCTFDRQLGEKGTHASSHFMYGDAGKII